MQHGQVLQRFGGSYHHQDPDNNMNDDIDDLLADNDDDDLLDKPKAGGHLGGLRHIIRDELAKATKALAEQVVALKGKLAEAATKKPDVAAQLKPLAAKIEAIGDQAATRGTNLKKAVAGVSSTVEALKGLKDDLKGKANFKDVDSVKAKISASIKKGMAGDIKVLKTVAKNQKYLKRTYKDLHHHP